MPRRHGPLREVATRPAPGSRVGIGEVDRVLGGGLVPGALVLLGGEPGIGKSTLVLEIAAGVARAQARTGGGAETAPVLYATGEESAEQLHLRADRLGLADGLAGSRIEVLAETALDAILAAAEALGARAARRRLGPDADDGRARGTRRLGGPGPRGGGAARGVGPRARHAGRSSSAT